MKQQGLLLKLEVRSDPGVLCVVRGALECLTQTLEFPEPECRAIVRAVDEALTNIIRHAYHGRPDRSIELSCRRVQGRRNGQFRTGIEILLSDSGIAVDPAKLRGRSLEDIRPGGLGLHFIRQCMDSVEFSRRNGKNRLRLVKYLGAQPTRATS